MKIMSATTVTTALPEFRVSKAALGRRLASVILRSQEAGLSPEEFTHTVSAVLESCATGDFDDDSYPCADAEILATEQAEVKKSIRRSESARKAAARRRELKEQRVKAQKVEKNSAEPEIKATEVLTVEVETALPEKPDETDSPAVTEESESATPAESTNSRKRRRRRRRRRKTGI